VNSVPSRPHAGGYSPASENGAATQWAWAFLGFGGAAALLVFDTRAWDALITGALQSVPSWFLLRAAEAVTMFGSVQLTGALVLWGAWAAGRRYGARTAFWLILPFLACFPLEFLLKMIGPHFRPSGALAPGGVVWAWFRVPPTVSFPSGHMLRVTYLVGMLLAWEAATRTRPRRPPGMWLLTLGGLGVFGASQVYLGNHWASDVAGGFLLGTSLVLISCPRWTW
jgi:membrane-associated phospholipid phosphatase